MVAIEKGKIADLMGCVQVSEHHEVIVYEDSGVYLSFLRKIIVLHRKLSHYRSPVCRVLFIACAIHPLRKMVNFGGGAIMPVDEKSYKYLLQLAYQVNSINKVIYWSTFFSQYSHSHLRISSADIHIYECLKMSFLTSLVSPHPHCYHVMLQ